MKTEKDVRDEIRRIRERVRELSGFWIGEASEGIYALEWVLGKREPSPSEDLGRPRGGREKIAGALVALAAKAGPSSKGLKPKKNAGPSAAAPAAAAKAAKPKSRSSRAKR
jgi:hypothetical protein